MRFENDSMVLWYATPDAPAPSGNVPVAPGNQQALVTINAKVQPPSASNTVQVIYRINEGPPATAIAALQDHDLLQKAQSFSVRLPALHLGDRVDYYVVARCPGRQVPAVPQAGQQLESFQVVLPVAAAGIERAAPANRTAMLKGNSPRTGYPGPAKTPFGASTESGGAISGMGIAAAEGQGRSAAANRGSPAPENAATLPNHKIRIDTLHAVLATKEEKQAVETELRAAKGDWTAALANLKDKLPEASFKKVALAQSLAEWSGDHVPVVKAVLAAQPDLANLRDLALRFNVDKLAAVVDAKAVPETTPGATAVEKQKNFAVALRQKLFLAEPTAVIHRMVEDAEIPIGDLSVRAGVTKFLSNQPDFNMSTTSIYTALKHPEAFKDITDEHRGAVVDHLKVLQRVLAISPRPEAVPALMKSNLTSAFLVAEKPESTFLRAFSPVLGEETARQVYTIALNNNIRNEQALITMRQTMRGTGLAIIDGKQTRDERVATLQKVTDEKAVPLNLSTLFGSLDYCECDECLSVYSPASYFVELLQFLRNNDLGPDPATGADPTRNTNIHPGIVGTPLEKLFRRRPDLGCLELTCENTFTVLPYIDLVNEVMESFVVHVGDYHKDTNIPKQVTLETFNVEGETTSELLAIPQHVNYDAYCILKNAVYPFNLPYSQSLDAIRIFLDYLKTSRWELLDTFRTAHEVCPSLTLSADDEKKLQELHKTVQDRAVDAEFLGLTQEEYIILTKEALWPKEYFEITQQTPLIDKKVYQDKIGVRQVCEYYGYVPQLSDWPGARICDGDMLSTDEDPKTGQIGLTFVKKQFLPRTGIQYTDLVELLKAQFINPNFPRGQALTILESIRFSYRFLQTLLIESPDPKKRFGDLIAFLEKYQYLAPAINAWLHPDPCKQQNMDLCASSVDFRNWVYCYFEQIGQLIVLETGEGPQLPIYGPLFADQTEPVGLLLENGTILDAVGKIVGHVTLTIGVKKGAKVFDQNGNLIGWEHSKAIPDNALIPVAGPIVWQQQLGKGFFIGNKDERKGMIIDTQLENSYEDIVLWLPARDTCDLEKVRLTHLNGTSLTDDEYDRMQRFIRLWRNLGWAIDETDKALIGLAAIPGDTTVPAVCDYVDFASISCTGSEISAGECGPVQTLACPDIPQGHYDITPGFLHQLVAVRKLLDRTGLPLPNLLAFWADIGTAGQKSLYAKLFLIHNLVAIDSVFQADANGNYLTQPAKITDHIPVLMAALKLKAEDITAIMKLGKMPDDTPLTLSNVSFLYRYSLLAKILHVRIPLLQDIYDLFGDPFKSAWDTKSAWATLEFLETWGTMEDAGFTFRQLDYLILNNDDPLRPIAPSQKKILQLTKTLYDGLNAIDHDHPDVAQPADAASDRVRSETGLLFEQKVVEQIIGLLEGTSVYTVSGLPTLTINLPDTDPLSKKLKYIKPKDPSSKTGSIQITGRLKPLEESQAKGLSTDPGWANAIDCAGKQSVLFFNDVLFGIFPDQAGAKTLLAGDFADPTDPTDPTKNSAPGKRFYFLQKFLPFLRKRLAERLIVDTLSGAAGLPSDITNLLLSDILVVGADKKPAMEALQSIKNQPSGPSMGWNGYLIPPADAAYTFVTSADSQPADLSIGGQPVSFSREPDDPSICTADPRPRWSSAPQPLKSGVLYRFAVPDRRADDLKWKTAISPLASIPSSALLPDYSSEGTRQAFVELYKATIVINGFNLSADEASYFQNHNKDKDDFKDFDFNTITLESWKRLQAYTDLRNNLPRTDTRLIDLFQWANHPDATALSEKIAAATAWKQDNIATLIRADHFDLDRPKAFRNEVNLVKLRQAIIVAEKIGVDIGRLFEWAKPGSKFWDCHQIAEDIRKAIRARFDEDVWEQVVKPLNDQLREHQKQALIAYLLVQQDLIDWGVIDADSLFEFFLIDVQMDSCMQTSRIKQAISSVQLFIQRCLLGLEERRRTEHGTLDIEIGVPNNAIDRHRWEWMQRYRVWEANRKVFCYPENWIVSELRDDKSPFYTELESELLQKDINTQTVQDALKSYLIKVNEVANLKVVGLFLDKAGNRLHVFACTRNAPYFFYYRYFQIDEHNWYPWEKVQVDIPSYDVETNGQITNHGTYLIPVVWNDRVLIFFPQFTKNTVASTASLQKTFQQVGSDQVNDHKPTEFWEIKMCWSEYRNGKWTQKQQSTKGAYHRAYVVLIVTSPTLQSYHFVPRIISDIHGEAAIVIDCYGPDQDDQGHFPTAAFSFHFEGSQVRLVTDAFGTSDPIVEYTEFHYAWDKVSYAFQQIYSLQTTDTDPLSLFRQPPLFSTYESRATVQYDKIEAPNAATTAFDFYHPFVHDLLGKMGSGTLDDLFAYFSTYYTSTVDLDKRADVYGSYINEATPSFNELKRAYSLYNWEATFHAPMLLVDRLVKANQFEQALNMCHYILNPFAEGEPGDGKRFWQFPPFYEINPEKVLKNLFLGLQPGKPDSHINEWRDKPFQPHVVARGRPFAYMMWVAMTYIKILIAWGDYLFRQDTIETINQATQLYVLAAHVYGPRGQKIPKRGKVLPETYNSLLDKWDAFGNAMVELELAFPFSNQTPLPIGVSNGVVGLANVFGFATTLYFCIPDNPELTALRDTIDDRLFKIRHCENIAGVFRQLPLFEPPIDPGLLVQAAAQGLSLASVLNDLNSPMPNYRFYFLLQKALEVCNELKALGAAFLSAKEKGDGEALSRLRAAHESAVQNLVMEVRKQQVDEAQKSLDALQQSRKGPDNRMRHYVQLIGEDLNKVPGDTTDFAGLTDRMEPVIDDSGLKLISFEKEEMDKASFAADWQINIGVVETLAGLFHALPSINSHGQPLGVGVSVRWGFPNLGNALQATARSLRIFSDHLSYQSSSASRKAGFLRQMQDRVLQANIAGYEIKNIDKQILTQNIRINIANQEITNQQKQIDNAKEVEDFLRSKYTNQELYSWMESQVRTLYYQAYTLAYDLAKKAEKVFRFERGLQDSNFIQYGYWDPAYDGLFAGERLYIGLKQLEAAYQEKRGYDFEIVKNISLQQLNPLALIDLREKGTCEFALPEVLFDMGYPGHYMRRIKSVALTFACVVGPATSVNCVLRLVEHEFRWDPTVAGPSDYPKHTDKTDPRFSTVNVPISAIAVSTGQTDSGVFELNFRDERYIPFEGAGAISKWRIELPPTFREFDYGSITDVVLQLRYTALDGGEKLRKNAADWLGEYVKSVEALSRRDEGLFALFDVRHDFPNEWYKATQPPAGAMERVMNLGDVSERLPIFTKFFTKGNGPPKIVPNDIYLLSKPTISGVSLVQGNGDGSQGVTFGVGTPVGTMGSVLAKGEGTIDQMSNWQLKITDVTTSLDQLWLVVRYTLGN